MPVKPFLMSEIRKLTPASPTVQHRSNTGHGTYNRFNLLSARPRTASVGKRLLSEDDLTPASPKVPRFNHNQVFEKLANQDVFLDTAKNSLKSAVDAINLHYKKDDGALGTILFNLSHAVESLVLHSEATKSNLIDLCAVPAAPTRPASNPFQVKVPSSFNFASAAAKPPPPSG